MKHYGSARGRGASRLQSIHRPIRSIRPIHRHIALAASLAFAPLAFSHGAWAQTTSQQGDVALSPT